MPALLTVQINGEKLTDIINNDHVNSKYLPHAKLPENVVAVPNAADAARGATLLVFVLPHQVRWLSSYGRVQLTLAVHPKRVQGAEELDCSERPRYFDDQGRGS